MNWHLTSLFVEVSFPMLTLTHLSKPKGALSSHVSKSLDTWTGFEKDSPRWTTMHS